jgi:hypothetical protein
MTTADLAGWFLEACGRELPLDPAIVPRHRAADLVWVSESLAGTPLDLPMTPSFLERPAEYVLAGHWGRGVSSLAIYFVGRWPHHRVFFRLPFGGAYGDRDTDARHAAEYLACYQAFRDRDLARLEDSTLIHNMGADVADLRVDGRTVRIADGGDLWRALASV